MAKSSSVPGLDRIRELFTSAERALLESSAGKHLLAASRQQLDKSLAQARSLRDKWRDLHATQARTTKRTDSAGTAAANARSRKKSEAFAAAIDRIQGRIAALGLASAAGRPRAAKPVTKAARTAVHRTTRASVKGSLAAATAELNRSRTPKPAAKPAMPVARAARGKKRGQAAPVRRGK